MAKFGGVVTQILKGIFTEPHSRALNQGRM